MRESSFLDHDDRFENERVKLKGDGNCALKLYHLSNNRSAKIKFDTRRRLERNFDRIETGKENELENSRFSSSNLLVDRNLSQILIETWRNPSFLKNIAKIFFILRKDNFYHQIIPL